MIDRGAVDFESGGTRFDWARFVGKSGVLRPLNQNNDADEGEIQKYWFWDSAGLLTLRSRESAYRIGYAWEALCTHGPKGLASFC